MPSRKGRNNFQRLMKAEGRSCLASSRAQEWPVSGFYQIISGDYRVCVEVCGLNSSLPNANQAYVELASLLSSLLVALKRNLLFGREQGEGSEYASSGPCIM